MMNNYLEIELTSNRCGGGSFNYKADFKDYLNPHAKYDWHGDFLWKKTWIQQIRR